mgnify:FL=1
MLIQLENVTFGYDDKPILENVSLTLSEGERAGFIGPNGEGKTTLIRLLSGALAPDAGRVLKKSGLRLGLFEQNGGLESERTVLDEMKSVFADVYAAFGKLRETEEALAHADETAYRALSQQHEKLEKRIAAADGYNIDVRIRTVLNGMGFEGCYGRVVSTMSGGEKTRLKLCRLLLEEPELLLLDEPTNHLDADTLFWLEDYLKGYRGAVFAVSHDRWFLDALMGKIYELERGRVHMYRGNYSKYKILKAERVLAGERAYEKQQKEIAELKDYVARNIVRATTASSAQSRVKKLENMELLEKPLPPPAPPVFRFATDAESEERTLEVRHLRLFAGERELFGDVEFTLRRGEKVALLGENGAGKSTLARALADGRDPAVRWGRFVKLGYYDQENAALDPDETVLGALWNKHRGMSQTQARALLAQAKLGEEDVDKKVRSLSGGERAKLALVLLEAERANVLILDEPTNHLDLQAREALETALKAFRGTLLFVSHDRYFTAALAEKVLDAADGRITPYPCGYAEYAEQKKRAAQQAAAAANAKKAEERAKQGAAAHRTKAERAEEAKRKQRVKELETRIAALEAEEAALQAAIADPAVAADYKALGDACARLETLHAALDSLYADYEKLI